MTSPQQHNDQDYLPFFVPIHVLIVDDMAANRQLLESLLQHRGHSADLAEDGQQAVKMFQQTHYDAVLMDLEMPHLNGLQATAGIRASEMGSEVPIIALTTRILPGDREQCLAGGMTDYVAKPFSARDLLITLESAVAKVRLERISRLLHVLPEALEMAITSTERSGVMDLDMARRRLGNDEQLLRDMAGFYIEDAPTLLRDLREAIDAGDVELATRSAHSVKGLSSNFDAMTAMALAKTIEDAGRAGNLDEARDNVEALDAEVGRVIEALKHDVLGV
jgi:CheY-like chemotaxis protein